MIQKCRIDSLLEDVRSIVDHNRKERFRQGKEFNIFYIQGTASDEVKVCRVMGELLDPKGKHGQGDFFLRRFMKSVLKVNGFSEEAYRSAHVSLEKVIDQARRIDLEINIGGRVFPIEVKIYASDQVNQCYDYYQYAVQKDQDAKLYYLTLDGHKPSDKSLGDPAQGRYEYVSFSIEILAWLESCINADELKQILPVREILIQFRDVIRDLTGRQEGTMMAEINKKVGSSYESMKAALEISKALPGVKTEKMREVFKRIQSHMERYMERMGNPKRVEPFFDEAELYYIGNRETHPSINYILHIPDKAIDEKIVLRFEITEYLYFGISTWFGENNSAGEKDELVAAYVRNHLKPDEVAEDLKDSHFYWWKYLNEECKANFKCNNDEYLHLFDEQGFEDYMKKACSTIDLVIDSLFV